MAKNMRNSRGFTLAEVMIVLTVIGVLTAILLPVARQSMPDEDLMKFKKAHNTLGTVIRELVTSDKYYLDGDLGKKLDSSLVKEPDYFCKTIADVINYKEVNCQTTSADDSAPSYFFGTNPETPDARCKYAMTRIEKPDLIFNDKTVWYIANPIHPFGLYYSESADATASPDDTRRLYGDIKTDGFASVYFTFCIDIDGIPPSASIDDCVNECPFGYGIRADGKILVGKKAQQWLERDVNEE